MNSSALDRLHRLAGQSKTLARLAVLIRNQCTCVIRSHLSDGSDAGRNGEAWLATLVADRCERFVDVGANAGEWTGQLLASRTGAAHPQGVLFDPSTRAEEMLRARFGTTSGIEVVRAAVSDRTGTVEFFEEPDAGETSSLVSGFSSGAAVARMVPTVTLDDAIQSRGWGSVDVVKIDAEGFDLHVLKGASQLLAEQRLGIVQFEYNLPWAAAGSTLSDATQLLRGAGYEVFLLKGSGLFLMDYARYGEFFQYANFIAVSPGWMELVRPHVRGTI